MSEQNQQAPVEEKPLALLAKEKFGHQFYGEVPEPQEASQEQGIPQEAEHDTANEDVLEVEEALETEQVQADQEAEESQETSEEIEITSLQEYIEHEGLDPEWFENLKVTGKVDGQPVEYSVKELRDRAQMLEAADKRLEDVKERTRIQNQELAQQAEAVQQQFAVAASIIGKAERLFDVEVGAVDWEKLRAEDPAEFAAKKAEVDERKKQLERMRAEAGTEYQQAMQKQKAEEEQNYRAYLLEQHQQLLQAIPEWQDESKASADKEQISSYLVGQGFDTHEVAGVEDHRHVLLVRKAMLYDAQKAHTQTAQKKIIKIPKVLKPGSPKTQEQASKENIANLKSRLKSSGDPRDALALLRAQRKQ